ncbi:hypothetical protein E2I00_009764, partial [Balaenoptera physalus]
VYTAGLPLFAQPYPVVTLGETATLYCNSGSTYDLFALTKQHGEGDFTNCIKQSYNRSHISPVTAAHTGICRTFPYTWKSSSKPLKLTAIGVYRKPSLSAHWGSSSKKTPSKKLSLRYHSDTWFDAFVLSRNGRVEFAQDLSSKYKAGAFEADFPVNAIFLMHLGTYRCYYGLHKNFPYLRAEPSDVPMLPER